MPENLLGLTQKEKQVAAKKLIENGYSSRKVEEILGIDHSSAIWYANKPTPEEMEEFSTIFDNYIQESKKKGISLAHARLLELIPREKRIDQVVKAAEYLEGKGGDSGNTINLNIGQLIQKDAKERGLE